MCVGKIDLKLTNNNRKNLLKKNNNNNNVKLLNDSGKIQEDILAQSTYYVKFVLFGLGSLYKKFQNTKYYKVLFHTTQPAHVITALCVLFMAYLIFPNENRISHIHPIWAMLYLGSFTTHFGAQMWMTFVSGLSLYFSLPRHIFGNVQKVLFPKYFLLNALLSLITLTIFVKVNNKFLLNTTEITVQTVALCLCFLIELIIRLYLTPPLLHLITIKTKIESEAKVGMEIGKLNAGNLVHCPHYMKIHKSFRKVHMTIAMGNLISICCTVLHLYYLSHKICLF